MNSPLHNLYLRDIFGFQNDDRRIEDSGDFPHKLEVIGTNKNRLPPRQPQGFCRVIQNQGKAKVAKQNP